MIGVTEKLAKTNGLLSELCARYERPREVVKLLAVSKKHPAEAIRAIHAAGQCDFGENFVAEARDKQRQLQHLPLRWHFIGRLQSNKTRAVAEHFDAVHTVDRLKIAERLAAQRPHYAPPLDVLVQVNVDAETTKGGISAAETLELANAIAQLPRLRLVGLMCLPRLTDSFVEQRQPFKRLATLAGTLRRDSGLALNELSMGTSSDFEAAIAEGATWVRLGTSIFGARPKQ
ncbi:MAG: YggS family pyridoxal phosphate-dependent enzyme [Pseudomonadota bacterium]